MRVTYFETRQTVDPLARQAVDELTAGWDSYEQYAATARLGVSEEDARLLRKTIKARVAEDAEVPPEFEGDRELWVDDLVADAEILLWVLCRERAAKKG